MVSWGKWTISNNYITVILHKIYKFESVFSLTKMLIVYYGSLAINILGRMQNSTNFFIAEQDDLILMLVKAKEMP